MRQVEILPDSASLARTVAEQLLVRLAAIQSDGRVPSVVLTGGTIAEDVHRAAAALESDVVDWTRVDFWWGDERYVPADSGDRNDRQARLDLLDVVGADPARVHAMPSADGVSSGLDAAAAAYAEELERPGNDTFDLVLLGLGPDGHVASLFPGSSQLSVDDRATVAVSDSPKPPPERISLTFRKLSSTREVWFLVSGEGKADAVARALADEGSTQETPVRGVTAPSATWWLDQEAAGSL